MTSTQEERNQHDVELARQAAAAFGRALTNGEIDAFLALLASEVDFQVPSVMQRTVLELNGHDEVRGYLEQTTSEYEELRVESKEIRKRIPS